MPALSLTLTPVKSKLDSLTLHEPIDADILDKLIRSDLLKDSFRNPTADFLYSDEKQQLEAYKKLVKCGRAVVTYKMTDGMSYGRSNPVKALGLFCIRREIRHTLAKNHFVDIDIENCHPVILLQMCKKNDIDCDNLEDYVENRGKYLKEVMDEYGVDRDAAKRLFIILLYFGSFEGWAQDVGSSKPALRSIKNFKKELQEIGKQIADANPTIAEQVKKCKAKKNVEEYNETGSVVSYFLQEIERRVL